MKIAVIADIPTRGFSGGRYYSVLIASCLSQYADLVDFYSINTKSQIYDGFRDNYKVKFYDWRRMEKIRKSKKVYDFCIVFVDLSGKSKAHQRRVNFAKKISNKTIMMSFETENWWNEFCPYKRDPIMWKPWLETAEQVDHVFYLSEENKRYGKKFYNKKTKSCVWPGPVNLREIKDNPEKSKELTVLARIGNYSENKGYDMLGSLDTPILNGYTININIANQGHAKESRILFNNDIKLNFTSMLDEDEKFSLLERSEILFFPSQFEGLGLPPLEAECCGCKVICTDLPVLRQHKNNKYFFFKRDYSDFYRVLRKCIKSKVNTSRGKQYLLMQHFGKKMIDDLNSL